MLPRKVAWLITDKCLQKRTGLFCATQRSFRLTNREVALREADEHQCSAMTELGRALSLLEQIIKGCFRPLEKFYCDLKWHIPLERGGGFGHVAIGSLDKGVEHFLRFNEFFVK